MLLTAGWHPLWGGLHAIGSRGELSQMVALHGDQIVDVPLAEATATVKRIDRLGEPVRMAHGLGIVFG